MRPRPSLAPPLAVAVALAAGVSARAQSGEPAVELALEVGTPLRVALPDRVRMKEVGQPVSGSLAEDVYAYDRVVFPAGTPVKGHIARFEPVVGRKRAGAMLNGDFTRLKRAVLQFDSLVLGDGREIAVSTEVRSATEHIVLTTREPPMKNPVERAAEDAAAGAKAKVASVKKPHKVDRLKHGLVMVMPYHPQYLEGGTVYSAALLSPVRFGTVGPTPPAPPGTRPAPGSVLRARLVTALSSATTPRGAPVRAVITQPVFSADGNLLLPEGAVLAGEVTLSKPARRFHRSGQLRFLFESVQVPHQEAATMPASVHSVQAARDQRLALDDEGGASAVESKTRFVAPALSVLAFAASMNTHVDTDTDGLGPETQYGTTGTRGLAGLFGWGLMGALLSQVSHGVAVAFGIIGVVRTVYPSVFGRGRDIVFPVDTAMEVQLPDEPEPSP